MGSTCRTPQVATLYLLPVLLISPARPSTLQVHLSAGQPARPPVHIMNSIRTDRTRARGCSMSRMLLPPVRPSIRPSVHASRRSAVEPAPAAAEAAPSRRVLASLVALQAGGGGKRRRPLGPGTPVLAFSFQGSTRSLDAIFSRGSESASFGRCGLEEGGRGVGAVGLLAGGRGMDAAMFRERGSAPKRFRHFTIFLSTTCIRALAA